MRERRSFGHDFTEEGIGRSAFDAHVDEIAWFDSLHGKEIADFVEHGPPCPSFSVAFANAFDENLLDGIFEACVPFSGASFKILQKNLVAEMLGFLRHIVRIVFRGFRAFTGGITEDIGHVVHDVFHELAGEVEILLRLRRKTDDYIRREIDFRKPFADLADAVKIFRRRVGAPHELQDSV